MAKIISSVLTQTVRLPIYGGGADIASGALIMPGTTAETNLGVAIKNSATSNADVLGVLAELHDYSVTGDALVNGSKQWFAMNGESAGFFPSRIVQLSSMATLVRVDYDLSGTSKADVAGYNAGTKTVTITNLEDNIDTGFLYVVDGTGAGQIEFIAKSASGSCILASAFSTDLDTSSDVVKILPLFHQFIVWTVPSGTAETKVGTTAAAGTGRCIVLERHIVRNGNDEMLDPDYHGGLTGLNDLTSFNLYNVVQLTNAGFTPID